MNNDTGHGFLPHPEHGRFSRPFRREFFAPAFAAFLLAFAILFIVAQKDSTDTSAMSPGSSVANDQTQSHVDRELFASGQSEVEYHPVARAEVVGHGSQPSDSTASPRSHRFHLRLNWINTGNFDGSIHLGLIDETALAFSEQSVSSTSGTMSSTSFSAINSPLAPDLIASPNVVEQTADTIAGTGWTGKGVNNNWSTSGNWDSNPPSTNASNERNLFFGVGYNTAGHNGFTTANNDLVNWAGYRITFEDQGFGNNLTFTITGNGFTLFAFGSGNFPRIENDSFVQQTFTLTSGQTITLDDTSSGTNHAEINPATAGGNIVFSAGTNIDLADSTQLRIFGASGASVTFNGAISSSGNSGNNSVVISSNTDGRTPTMIVVGTGSTYGGGTFVNAGTLQLGAAGGANGAVSGPITLGDNNSGGGNTPLAQLTIAGSGGQTFTNSLTARSGSAGQKQVTTSYSGTDTWSGTVSLDVPLTFNTGSGSTLQISGQITGNAGGTSYLIKTGSGTLILQNTSNTYTGTNSASLSANGTQINAGTLGINGDGSFGLAPSGAYNNIQFTGTATLQDTANNITLNANRNISIAMGVTATFDTNGNTLAIPGQINGSGSLTVAGNGTLTLSGANNFGGGVTLSAGSTLNINNATALGTGTFTINGGTINQTAVGSLTLTSNNPQNWNGDFTFTGSNILSLGTGAVTMNGSRQVTVNNANNGLSVGGVISGSGFGLTKLGPGSLGLTGANTYTGPTIISAGTLSLSGGGSLSTSSAITDNGTLSFNKVSATQGVDFSGAPITGTGGLIQFGSGPTATLVLNALNSYMGNTSIQAGFLSVSSIGDAGVAGNLGAGTTINFGTIFSTGRLVYTGTGENTSKAISLTGNGLIDQSGTGLLKFTSNVAGGFRLLTLQGSTAGSGEIAGVISNAMLDKAGTGTWTLSGVNTYTGTTTVDGGKLLVNGSTSSGSAVTVNNSGSVIGGTGTINGTVNIASSGAILQGGNGTTGTTLTLANSSLTLASGSIIELALGTAGTHSTLALTGSFNGFNSNQAFNLDNFQTGTYDNIITGVASGITTTGWTVTGQGGAIYSFVDDGSNIDLTVTAIPEPSTWIGGAAALAILLVSQRRRVQALIRTKR